MPAIQIRRADRGVPVDKWDLILAINLAAAFHTIRTAVPGMKARKWGRINQITAVAHSLGRLSASNPLCHRQAGLAGLTKTVALELATFGTTAELHQSLCSGRRWREADPDNHESAPPDRGAGQERRAAGSGKPTKHSSTVDQVGGRGGVFSAPTPPGPDTTGRQHIDRWRLDPGIGPLA